MKRGITKSELLELMTENYIKEQEYNDDQEINNNDDENPFNDETDLSQYTPNDNEKTLVGKHRKYNIYKLKVPRYFSSDKLRIDKGHILTKEHLVKMATKNPRNGEIEAGLVCTSEIIETPNGSSLYVIKNYGVPRQTLPYSIDYMDTKELGNGEYNFYSEIPVRQEFNIEKPNKYESGEKSENELIKYSKHRVSQVMNRVFNNTDIQRKLHTLFVSKIVGDYRHTEMITNREKRMKWGVDSPELNFSYNSIEDSESLQKVLNYITQKFEDMNIDVVLTAEDMTDLNNELDNLLDIEFSNDTNDIKVNNVDGEDNKQPDYMRRAYAGYIYTGGEWKHTQRVGSEVEFIKQGKFTPVYNLKKKNIQEGKIGVSSRSDLSVKGDIVGNAYELIIRFKTELVVRPEGQNEGVTTNDIIKPIVITVNRTLPDGVNAENFKIDSRNDILNEFLFNINDGLLYEGLQQIRSFILNEDNGMVINKIMNLILNNSSTNNINETIGKKIKISEEQLKRLTKMLNEEKFDDSITNFNRSKESNVPVNHDDINLLFNIAKDWCQNRVENPDCKEIGVLRDKLKLY